MAIKKVLALSLILIVVLSVVLLSQREHVKEPESNEESIEEPQFYLDKFGSLIIETEDSIFAFQDDIYIEDLFSEPVTITFSSSEVHLSFSNSGRQVSLPII